MKEQKVIKRLKMFILLQKPFLININLFIINLKIEIPSGQDWYVFSFCIFPLITFSSTSCYGAGWSFRIKWKYLHIHLGRIIIYLDFGVNMFSYNNLKFNWKLSALVNKSKEEQKQFMETLNKLNSL